jgi:DNA repair protein SbcC/Rad50
MRPIRLKMLGIGPYASEINLDFSKLNEEGLFLITGATGAGKTSIFDGITYALFGRANFDDNEKKNGIICDYISDKEKPKAYAEYTFDLGGIEYRVRRTPAYEYINRNGKPDKKGERVEIEFEDEIKTNKKEVDKFIEEDIIKLDYQQFKKIIMLAQGSFSEFIKSNSNQKSEILKQIFNTDIYEKISYKLKDKSDAIRKSIYKNKGDVFASLRTLEIEDPEWKSMIEKEILEYEKLNLIINSNKSDIEITIKNKEIEKSKLDIITLTKEIEESKVVNEGIKKLNLAEQNLLTLEKQSQDIETKKIKIKKNQEAMKINGEYEILLDSKKNVKDRKVEYEAAKDSLEKLEEKSKVNIAGHDKFKDELEETSKLINKMSVLEEDLKSFKSNTKKITESNKKIECLEKVCGEIKKELIDLTIQEDKFSGLEITQKKELEDRKKLSGSKEILEKKQLILTPVLANLDTIASMEAKIELQQKKIDRLAGITQEKLDIYSDLNNRWFQNEAFNLSTKLEPGKPCMVCGSIDHPNLPEKPANAPTEKELKKVKENYETSKGELDLSKGELSSSMDISKEEKKKLLDLISLNNLPEGRNELLKLKDNYCNEITTLNTRLEKLSTDDEFKKIISKKEENSLKINRSAAEEQELLTNLKVLNSQLQGLVDTNLEIEKKFKENKLEIEEFEKILDSSHRRNKELKTLISGIESVKEEIKTQNIQLKGSKNNIEKLSKTLETQEQGWGKALIKNNFKDLDEYQSILNFSVNLLREEIDTYNKEVTRQKTIISESEKFKNLDRIDLEDLNEKSKLIIHEIKEIDTLINKERTKLNSFINPEKKLEESRKILETKEKQYNIFNKLYEISVGKYGEKRNNITFQNYVLAVYFQDVLDRANDRFSIMTNNQYHMRLDTSKKGNAGSGLEVNIFDSHTGRERSIKTLSGGETFKASMALALGLSDVVQSQNGGIKLDSVFIDEGFGTLDEESLSVAMDILMELKSSGRTVGIISHVSELKQTITSQIKVEKTVRGSTAEVIY